MTERDHIDMTLWRLNRELDDLEGHDLSNYVTELRGALLQLESIVDEAVKAKHADAA